MNGYVRTYFCRSFTASKTDFARENMTTRVLFISYNNYRQMASRLQLSAVMEQINPLAPNDHCTGRYFATPECRMTSTLVTSGKVEKRVFSEAKGRSTVFQISSIQCLVFCCCF